MSPGPTCKKSVQACMADWPDIEIVQAAHVAHVRSGSSQNNSRPLPPGQLLAMCPIWVLSARFRHANRQQHCSAGVLGMCHIYPCFKERHPANQQRHCLGYQRHASSICVINDLVHMVFCLRWGGVANGYPGYINQDSSLFSISARSRRISRCSVSSLGSVN